LLRLADSLAKGGSIQRSKAEALAVAHDKLHGAVAQTAVAIDLDFPLL
jgi:hypothetical protein